MKLKSFIKDKRIVMNEAASKENKKIRLSAYKELDSIRHSIKKLEDETKNLNDKYLNILEKYDDRGSGITTGMKKFLSDIKELYVSLDNAKEKLLK